MTRHELLQGSIGTFSEEDDAYTLVTTLIWVMPLVIFLAALVDVGFVYLYMMKAHPWIGILANEEEEKEKNEEREDLNEERNETVEIQ